MFIFYYLYISCLSTKLYGHASYHFLSRVLIVLFFFKDCLLPFLASCSWQHTECWVTFSCLWQPKSRRLVRPVLNLHFWFKTQFQYGKAWSVVRKGCFHLDIQGSNSRVITKVILPRIYLFFFSKVFLMLKINFLK